MMKCTGLLAWIVVMFWVAAGPAPARGQIVFGPRETTKASIENLKLHGTFALHDFIRVNVVDGLLEAKLIVELPNQVEAFRVRIKGSDATWVIRNRMLGAGTYLTITRYDFDAAGDAFWSTMLTVRANYVTLYAQTGDGASGIRVRLTQSGRTLRFSVQTAERGVHRETFNAAAESLKQLQAEHPQEVRKYLAPAIKLVCGHWLFKPGAADVYRVFDAIPADPGIARKLDAILLMLEADSFQEREKGSKALSELGAAGVVAALRRNTSDLTIEAKNRMDLFIAAHSRLDFEDLRAAKQNVDFLLDSLDNEDVAVRSSAKEALEKLAGKPIGFDASLTGADRQKAIETLRRMPELQPKSPTTQPTSATRATTVPTEPKP